MENKPKKVLDFDERRRRIADILVQGSGHSPRITIGVGIGIGIGSIRSDSTGRWIHISIKNP